MNVLVACEESQEVCKAFRAKGHLAYSCDVQCCSGGHPEWHIKGDVLSIINQAFPSFHTENGDFVCLMGGWGLIIAHPPCTYLTVTGNRWFNVERYGEKAVQRTAEREEAAKFFMAIANTDCPRIAIENPVGVMSTRWRKPDQIIQPYQFGHPERKATCIWLKNLPKLVPTEIVNPVYTVYKNGKGTDPKWHMDTKNLPPAERAKARSKTFPGIAKAMAEQWG